MTDLPHPPTRGDNMLMGRLIAAIELLRRTGMQEVEIAFDDDTGATNASVLWWCEGRWEGERLFSEHFPYPAYAAEDLLSRVINGGMCTHCKRTTVVGVDIKKYCTRLLVASNVDDEQTYRYRRGCLGNDND